MKTYMMTINTGFARRKKMPSIFVGYILRKTARAYYVYGHGSMSTRKTGECCVCGRPLTHPVSVILGIGPECGGHWWDWKAVGGYTMENIERLKREMEGKMRDMTVDTWMPQSVVKSMEEVTEKIHIPSDHKMLDNRVSKTVKTPAQGPPPRRVELSEIREAPVFKIIFPYSREDVSHVRTLEGRWFNSVDKSWTCPPTEENLKRLREWGFSISKRAEQIFNHTKVDINDLPEVHIDNLKHKPFPYQRQGVSFVEARNGRALIGDEMGLGKTAQTLMWLEMRKDVRPIVIVVPASLKLNWRKEITMWMNSPKVEILSGTTPYHVASEIAIINYDILPAWEEYLRTRFKPKAVVCDEIHYIKNNGAKRTKAVKKLSREAPHFIGLSGTPIVNRPVEFYNALQLIEPTLFPNRWHYLQRYCGARHNGFGWDFTGATNTQELHQKVQRVMIRRLKQNVLKDLPDKLHAFTPIEITNRGTYTAAESDFIEFVRSTEGSAAAERASNAETLSQIEALKQLAVSGKMEQAMEWMDNFLESDQKLVVFAVHKFVIDRLMARYGQKAVKIDGSVSQNDRNAAVEKFQNDDNVRLFVGNIKAAGVGLTLTAASNVAFLELPWTPGELTQAEDRCHRIGQTSNVNIHYLLAEGTIEEGIASMLDRKRKVLDSVLDGRDTGDTSLLTEIMKHYKQQNVEV